MRCAVLDVYARLCGKKREREREKKIRFKLHRSVDTNALFQLYGKYLRTVNYLGDCIISLKLIYIQHVRHQ